jgi:hypothetical protein
VTTGKVVGCILLATDELLRVEELAVSASPHLINHSGLKVNKHSTGHMLASASLTEEGVESIITSSNSLVTRHLTISLKIEQTHENICRGTSKLMSDFIL